MSLKTTGRFFSILILWECVHLCTSIEEQLRKGGEMDLRVRVLALQTQRPEFKSPAPTHIKAMYISNPSVEGRDRRIPGTA